LDHPNGPLLSDVKVPDGTGWQDIEAGVSNLLPGTHNLVVVLIDDKPAEIDWIRFTE
jgi:hypothetical protein